MIKRIFSLLLLILFCISIKAQPALSVKSIIAAADTFRNRMPAEKLYMQFDKPYYSAGDTIWFKAYLFNADFLKGSQKSGIVYIELTNDTNKVLLQRLLPLAYGIGWGNIVLNKDDVPEGSYTIRAYTNLMRNFGEDLVFKKSFYVSGNALQNWLVTSNVHLFKQGVKDSIRMALQFNRLDKQILGLRDMEIRVLEGRRTLFRDKVQTAGDGTLDINFSLPEKADARKISLVATDFIKNSQNIIQEDHKVIVPIPVNRPENMDLQFMPEGGNLVAGIATKIGFKALGEDGLGTDVKGKIYNNAGVEISEFQSAYKGMGSVVVTPKAGENYVAKVALTDGSLKSYPLSEVKPTGSTLSIRNSENADSVELMYSISPGATYFLVAQSRGTVCYGAVIRSSGNRKIAKSLFPTGITKFTILTADKQPVNERVIFIDHHDNLNITINPEKSSYKARDSIALSIEVKDHDGNPVQGSFSVAITDDNQVKSDSLGNNILTSLLLSSDLKDNIEDPRHYFQTGSSTDLDNLLLTQGWKGYSWKDLFNPSQNPAFEAEKELTVKGRVSNVLGKSLTGTSIMLLSSRPGFFKDTVTNKDGSFLFANFPQADTLTFQLQARNKNDKSFNVGIVLDEFKPPVFKPENYQFLPWYVNSDTTLLQYIKTSITQKEEQLKIGGSNVLAAVTINTKRIVHGSKNLNGAGNADIVLDEKDMVKAKKVTLFEMLEKRLPGFRKTDQYHRVLRFNVLCDDLDFIFLPKYADYAVFKRAVKLVIDGVFTGNVEKEDERFMNYLTAEDIRGIEIMSSGKNRNKYFWQEKKPGCALQQTPDGDPAIYIEVTTWSGHGYEMKTTPGTYFFRSIPFAGIQEFYRPKYPTKNPVKVADLRSVIHWEPNLVTDKNGMGFISFYAADNPGTYTVITEGSDMDGNIGSNSKSIKIIK